jgi:hypothetical protein
MSIKEFIETAGAESIFDGNLPIPFIDNIAITDNDITIGTSIYIKIPAHDYQADGGSEFLSTFEDVQVCIQPLFDRDSDVDSCGVEISNKYYDLPKDAWTRVTKKGMSPIKYWNGRSTISIITRFAFEPDTADLTTLIGELRWGADSLFIDYTLPNGALAGFDDIDEYVDSISRDAYDSSDAELYDANMRSTLIGLIQQAISANDKDVVEQVFGYTSYRIGGPPDESAGFIPNMQIIKCELKGFPSPIENIYPTYTITDVLENTDGSAIVKLSNSASVSDSRLSKNLYDRSTNMGIKNMGFAAYTISNHEGSISDMSGKILAAAKTKNSSIKYWESAISKTSQILFIEDDDVTVAPIIIYKDSNDKIYNNAMRSIDGNYYSADGLTPETLISSMLSLQELQSASEATNNSFQYLVAQSAEDPINAIPLMNKFRRAFPDKSTVTPAGLFYNKFATILYAANQNLKSGTQLIKNIVSNPIIKDWRSYPGSYASATHIGASYEEAYNEIFSFENALWSRYTEVTGKDAFQSSMISQDPNQEMPDYVSGDYTNISSGFGWNYNFIDHGFLFFNYERALKTTSYAARYLNIRIYEKYFGQKIFNTLFLMKGVLLGTYWGDANSGDWRPDSINLRQCAGTMASNIEVDSQENITVFYNIDKETYSKGDSDEKINSTKLDPVVDNDITSATAENGYVVGDNIDTRIGNEFGGADAMINSKEYSFIALRAFSPIMIQDNLSPLKVDETFIQKSPINYRVACFEVQKCDHWDPTDDIVTTSNYLTIKDGVLSEIEENNVGGAFTSAILVRDETHQVVIDLSNKLDAILESYQEFLNAASDTCSFNEHTGFFNEHFATTIKTNWPIVHLAPWFRAATEGLIIEDILFNTTDGDTSKMLLKIKNVAMAISPETGTVNGITNYRDKLYALRAKLDEILAEFGSDKKIVGHIYGHGPYYDDDYDAVKERFETQIQSTAECNVEMAPVYTGACWVPDAGYDNFPMFPTDHSLYDSTSNDDTLTTDTDIVTIPDPWVQLFTDNDLSVNLVTTAIHSRIAVFNSLRTRGLPDFDITDFLEEFFYHIIKNEAFSNAWDYTHGVDLGFEDNFGLTSTEAATATVDIIMGYEAVAGAINEYFNSATSTQIKDLAGAEFNIPFSSSPAVSLSSYLISTSYEVIVDVRDLVKFAERKEDVWTGAIDLGADGGFDITGDGSLLGGDLGGDADDFGEFAEESGEDDGDFIFV